MVSLLASTEASVPLVTEAAPPLVTEPAGLLAILLAVLAAIFWTGNHPVLGKIFKVIPMLVFCYFVPTLLTTLGVIPDSSDLYSWVKAYVLPASLVLLILSLDLPAIIRLGPKAGIMLLAGTFGVVIGGPIALWVTMSYLPEDAWRGMSALCGSWIGGGANFVAMGDMADASDAMIATMVIPDVFVANIWMGVLLYLSGKQRAIDKFTGADASAIRDLERRMEDFQQRVNRLPSLADLLLILAIGFGGSWLGNILGVEIDYRLTVLHGEYGWGWITELQKSADHTTWKYVLVTTLGLVLSFTRARDLEGAGASKVGSVMIYLLVACIGAHANFHDIIDQPWLLAMGGIWMAIHIIILLTVGWLIRAPIFFIAVGSQANIGGAASAPVVAAAFHPALAPVGALLAIAGYVLGTYAGYLCMRLLMMVAGVESVEALPPPA